MDENVSRIAGLDCATLSDALDRLGVPGQCARISPRADAFRLSGRAMTVAYGAAGQPPGTVGDYIDDAAPGSVIVLDNRGREDATVWGDILTQIAHRRGLAGTVIDGVCRDVSLCRALNYPVFSRGAWMRTGKDRVQVESVGAPVSIGGVRVAPGDLVRGDADGVVVLPRHLENEVLAAAEEIHRAEEAIRDAITSGMRLDEARKQHRYHSLQTARKAGP